MGILAAIFSIILYYYLGLFITKKYIPISKVYGWVVRQYRNSYFLGLFIMTVLHIILYLNGYEEGHWSELLNDGMVYYDVGKAFLNSGISPDTVKQYVPQSNVIGFSIWVMINQFIFGFNPFAIKVTNVFLYALSVPLFIQIASFYFEENTSRRASKIYLAYVPFLIYSSLLLKEFFIMNIAFVSLINAYLFIERRRTFNLMMFLFSILVLSFSREWVAFIIFLSCLLYFRQKLQTKILFVLVIFLGAFIYFWFSNSLFYTSGLSEIATSQAVRIRLKNSEDVLIYGGIGGIINLLIQSPKLVISLAMVNTTGYLFGTYFLFVPFFQWPFPQPDFFTLNLIHMGNVVWWFLLPSMFWGMKKMLKDRNKYSLVLIPIFIFLAFFIFYTSDDRYRLISKPFFFLVSAYGFQYLREWRKYIIFYAIFLILLSIYILPRWVHYGRL